MSSSKAHNEPAPKYDAAADYKHKYESTQFALKSLYALARESIKPRTAAMVRAREALGMSPLPKPDAK